MADIALLASQADDAPLGYQVPGAQEIILKSITASFDGTGASGDFVPTLQILAPNGAVLAACPVSTPVVAGASADVSWFPRGGVSTSGSGGSGIQYDTYPQSGHWLYSATTGFGGPNNVGVDLEDTGGKGYRIRSNGVLDLIVGDEVFIQAEGSSSETYLWFHSSGQAELRADNDVLIRTGGAQIALQANTALDFQINSGTVIAANSGTGVQKKLGLYGVTPVLRAAAPITLADVITAGRNLGIWQ